MASKNKKEITLMTLLANEAPRESQAILLKHTGKKAKNFNDLEVELANMYFQATDKVALEKELAEIHPHKKWILRVLAPEEKPQIIIEEKPKDEVVSNAEGDECACKRRCRCGCNAQPTPPVFSNFSGLAPTTNEKQEKDYLGVLAVVAIFTLGVMYIHSNSMRR